MDLHFHGPEPTAAEPISPEPDVPAIRTFGRGAAGCAAFKRKIAQDARPAQAAQ